MILKIYSVYDSAAEAYLQPFFMASKGMAIRAFGELVNDTEHSFGKHPDDYCLFELGTWDDSDASIVMHSAPQSLGTGLEHRAQT